VIEALALDAGVLSMAAHPRPNREFIGWLDQVLGTGTSVYIPEIADYEVRRELLRAEKNSGLQRLDQLKTTQIYLPLTTAAMLQAARFWADARRRGRPTAGTEHLDCDVILAAQAREVGAVVVTENLRHLSLFVEARSWMSLGAKDFAEGGG